MAVGKILKVGGRSIEREKGWNERMREVIHYVGELKRIGTSLKYRNLENWKIAGKLKVSKM